MGPKSLKQGNARQNKGSIGTPNHSHWRDHYSSIHGAQFVSGEMHLGPTIITDTEPTAPLLTARRNERHTKAGDMNMMLAAEIGEMRHRPASSIMNMAALQTQERTTKKKMSFLDLPYELRLHIYHLVHQVSPVQCKRLTPWQSFSRCALHVVQPIIATGEVAKDDIEEPWEPRVDRHSRVEPRLLSAQRPFAHMPTSVLLACHQTFAEARCIPFWQNEFAFINWFSSGLSSALAFTRGRQPWQRTAIRFIRLEMFVRDLVEDRLVEWIELCRLWSGVRGLRLTVSAARGEAYRMVSAVKATACGDAWSLVAAGDSATTSWVTEGLGQLGELRQLEVELADSTWSSSSKVAWCRQLERILQSPDGGEVNVVCVERKIDW